MDRIEKTGMRFKGDSMPAFMVEEIHLLIGEAPANLISMVVSMSMLGTETEIFKKLHSWINKLLVK